MSCKQLFINLGGVGVNTGVLQIAGGVALDSTLRFVEDQNGTDSPLKLSTNRVQVQLPDCSTPFNFGALTASINTFNGIGFDTGTLYPLYDMQAFIGGVNRYLLGANGLVLGDLSTHTQNGYLSVKGAGGNIASYRSSSNVEVGYIDNSGRTKGVDFLSNDLSSGSLTTARPMKFGDKATITDAGLTTLGLDSQIAIEHNGQVYYVPVSTSQFS